MHIHIHIYWRLHGVRTKFVVHANKITQTTTGAVQRINTVTLYLINSAKESDNTSLQSTTFTNSLQAFTNSLQAFSFIPV